MSEPRHPVPMGTKERLVDRGDRRGRRLLGMAGDELREARLSAGLSQAEVGRAAGASHTKISRVETGRLTSVSLVDLARLAGVVGLDLSARLYPAGPPIRDAAHVALLGRLRACLAPTLRLRAEVPLPLVGDPRAWDAIVDGCGPPLAVEAETKLRDIQALLRRVALKQRDADLDRVLLLVSNSRANRQIVRTAAELLAEMFPVPSRVMLAALAEGRDPGGSGIVLL